MNAYTIESGGKSSESSAQTWSIGIVVIMYVAAIVLTRPTLGIASITVPPARSTSLNVRYSMSAISPHPARPSGNERIKGIGISKGKGRGPGKGPVARA